MQYSNPRELIDAARQLLREGNRDAAHHNLRDAASKGEIEAMIELSHMALNEGNRDESDKWMDSAEEAIQPNDLEGRISLGGAYSLGLGRGTRDEQQQRALKYLEEVATAGNPVAQESLALHFLHGLNGCTKDERRFEHWIQQAIAAESHRALYIYVEFLFLNRRPIPSDLRESLATMKLENKSAEKLLRTISKAEKGNQGTNQ